MDTFIAVIVAFILAQFIDGRVAFALSFVVLVGRRLLRHQRAIKDIQRLGLTPEVCKEVSKDLQDGNHDAAVQRIAEHQEKQLADLLAIGVDVRAMTPEIGRDIKWGDIVSQVFRVLEFDRLQTTVGPNNTVKTPTKFDHYGHLLVESPILNQPGVLPIVHRDDFRLAASVFDDPQLSEVVKEEGELLVTYVPKHKLPGGLGYMWHVLHYVICPRGTLDEYYEVDNAMHMAKPAPEKLFGPFVWYGEIRVQVKASSQLATT
ncbi:MAG: hypothetical protein DRP66_02715 [Planctomycetota bacterium]|nr:MAG: hypothetical protein DRP66_02715 [Planctomycetota bacterium]